MSTRENAQLIARASLNLIDLVAAEKIFNVQYLFDSFGFKSIPSCNSPGERTVS